MVEETRTSWDEARVMDCFQMFHGLFQCLPCGHIKLEIWVLMSNCINSGTMWKAFPGPKNYFSVCNLLEKHHEGLYIDKNKEFSGGTVALYFEVRGMQGEVSLLSKKANPTVMASSWCFLLYFPSFPMWKSLLFYFLMKVNRFFIVAFTPQALRCDNAIILWNPSIFF